MSTCNGCRAVKVFVHLDEVMPPAPWMLKEAKVIPVEARGVVFRSLYRDKSLLWKTSSMRVWISCQDCEEKVLGVRFVLGACNFCARIRDGM
jgi:hypothetical protein